MADERVERRLAAILAADVVGYSRLMGADEVGTLRALKAIRRELADAAIASHHGRVVKTTGDGVLIEFASVVDAVACAVSLQRGMITRNATVPMDKRIIFRIGINVGDIIIEDGDIFGDGVNIAARLEGLCEPGGLCVSKSARDQVRDKLPISLHDLGEQEVKNIARPVRVFGLSASDISELPDDEASRLAVTADSTSVESRPHSLLDKPSIAVLPFRNISGDPRQEYFADGIVEELTAALSRVRSFFVIARNSAFTYKGKDVEVKQVGRELGVRYLLEGSVQRDGDRVRITAQLIDTATASHLWSDRYEGSIQGLFDLQDCITESVLGVIQPSILLAEIERTKRKRPQRLDAYDCVLQAFPHVWAFNPAANTMALNHLNRAIAIEPDYPLALSLAALCHTRQATYVWTSVPAEAKAEGLRLAKLAGDMTNDDPMVLTVLCTAHAVVGDLDIASILIEKALALDPNSAMAWSRSGWLNSYLMRPDVSIEHFQRAIRLSPFDPMNFSCLIGIGCSHWVAERYEEALSWVRKGMLERPDWPLPLRIVAACLAQLGRFSEAREMIRQVLRAEPDITISKVMEITPYREADFLRRYAEGLRWAGLPE